MKNELKTKKWTTFVLSSKFTKVWIFSIPVLVGFFLLVLGESKFNSLVLPILKPFLALSMLYLASAFFASTITSIKEGDYRMAIAVVVLAIYLTKLAFDLIALAL